MAKAPPEIVGNYLVLAAQEEPAALDEQEPLDAEPSIFTDTERFTLKAMTPQDKRRYLIDMVSPASGLNELEPAESRQMVGEMMQGYYKRGVLTLADENHYRITYNQPVLRDLEWLSAHGMQEDIRRLNVRQMIASLTGGHLTHRHKPGPLTKIESELTEGGVLDFTREAVYESGRTSPGLAYIIGVYPGAEIDVSDESLSTLGRLQARGVNMATAAVNGIAGRVFRKYDGARDYVDKKLKPNLHKFITNEQEGSLALPAAESPSIGDIVSVIADTIGSPQEFLASHESGLQELAALDRNRHEDSSTQRLFDSRVSSFLSYVAQLEALKTGDPSDSSVSQLAEQLREKKIAELADIGGGQGDMAKLCQAVARELTANKAITAEAVTRVTEDIDHILHESFQRRHGRSGYEAQIVAIKDLLRRENVMFDDGVFRRLFREDS